MLLSTVPYTPVSCPLFSECLTFPTMGISFSFGGRSERHMANSGNHFELNSPKTCKI